MDLGTGDGRFVYQSARQNPHRFYLGIDASANSLEKISEKIHRKPAKGGLKNALFIQAAVEALLKSSMVSPMKSTFTFPGAAF